MICNALFSDFYELTMAQGFWKKGDNTKTVFEMFFRSNPFKGGYSIFTGLEPLLETIQNFHFEKSDIDWLKSLGIFEKDFLEYIADFKFSVLSTQIPGSFFFHLEAIPDANATPGPAEHRQL